MTGVQTCAHPSLSCSESPTAHYLTGFRQIPLPAKRRNGHKGQVLRIEGATANNLRNVDAAVPLGTFTCVTGVSGSGKSTLTIETLYFALARRDRKSTRLNSSH